MTTRTMTSHSMTSHPMTSRTRPDLLTRIPVLTPVPVPTFLKPVPVPTRIPKTTAHAHPGDVERDVETIR
ncbi:hypothetical protein ACFV0Y_19335 [Streptomyces sp. NPDC059569]|uniref:hypothetical protein n=1 Tax=Streptomyces sp. NPDC059569 TaxID=3346869 RepID=UPI003698C38D